MKNLKYYLNKLGIGVVQVLRENNEEGYFVVIGKIKSKLVLLKLISKSSRQRVMRTKKDIVIDKMINKYNINHKNKINKNRIIDTGEDKDFIWIVREYIKGESLATISNKNTSLLYDYDKIDQRFYDQKNKILDCVVITIDAIRQLKTDDLCTSKGFSFPSRFPQNVAETHIRQIEQGICCNLSEQMNFNNELFGKKNQSKNAVMSFGDLIPANIIYGEDEKIYFLDFEWFGLDNYIFDISYLWLFLWQYPSWQAYLLDKTVHNQQDKDYFRANIIRAVIGWYTSMRVFKKEKKYKNDKFKNHIWTRYLIAAGKSFDAVLEAKP